MWRRCAEVCGGGWLRAPKPTSTITVTVTVTLTIITITMQGTRLLLALHILLLMSGMLLVMDLHLLLLLFLSLLEHLIAIRVNGVAFDVARFLTRHVHPHARYIGCHLSRYHHPAPAIRRLPASIQLPTVVTRSHARSMPLHAADLSV